MSDNYLLHKRILVVDDEQALLDMICSILQAYGFQNTTTAKSVREALMEAENCPHILLQNAAENQKLFFSFVSFILTKAGCHYNEIRS